MPADGLKCQSVDVFKNVYCLWQIIYDYALKKSPVININNELESNICNTV